MKDFVDIKTIEPLLKKVALDSQEWKKIVNSFEWEDRDLKDYFLSLAN